MLWCLSDTMVSLSLIPKVFLKCSKNYIYELSFSESTTAKASGNILPDASWVEAVRSVPPNFILRKSHQPQLSICSAATHECCLVMTCRHIRICFHYLSSNLLFILYLSFQSCIRNWAETKRILLVFLLWIQEMFLLISKPSYS